MNVTAELMHAPQSFFHNKTALTELAWFSDSPGRLQLHTLMAATENQAITESPLNNEIYLSKIAKKGRVHLVRTLQNLFLKSLIFTALFFIHENKWQQDTCTYKIVIPWFHPQVNMKVSTNVHDNIVVLTFW